VIVPLVKAATDRRLLGATIDWRPRQVDLLQLFGRDDLRLVVVSAGRQGGKTSAAVATAIWNATMRDDLDAEMRRGQTRYVLICAPREDQSREVIQVAAGMVFESPALRDFATVKADRIDFVLPSGARTAIRALPANPRSIRGMTASLTIIDEAAWLNTDDASVVTDERMIEALEGSMSVFDAKGLSKLVLVSTPAGESGRFYELFRDIEAGLIPNAAVMQAPAWELNPALDTEDWKESKRRLLGVDGFEQEHGARLVAGGGQFFDLRGVEFEDGPAPPEAGRGWVAGLDPAFHADRFGVVLVGESIEEPGVLLVGRVEAIAPGEKRRSLDLRRAREDRTLERVWELIEPYQPRVVTDQHQADAVQSFFGRLGASARVVNLTGPIQTAAFTSTRARLMDGSLRLWRHPLLVEELRRVRARDTESIVMPRFGGGHCDAASALALAVFELRHATGAPPGDARGGGPTLTGSGLEEALTGSGRLAVRAGRTRTRVGLRGLVAAAAGWIGSSDERGRGRPAVARYGRVVPRG
jgi:hypothetical protein